jgi:TIR domain
MSTSPNQLAPSFTRAYQVDVFLSYGHIDNQESWVTHLHSRLQTRLQELLGTDDVMVWRDLRLGGTDAFEDVLRQRVSGSALFISVLSPRYVASASCAKELDWFVAAAEKTGGLRVDTQSRLVRVVKTRLPEGMEPLNFKATLGYEFYESNAQDPTVFHEFDAEPGMPRFNQFRERCDVLAQAVARMLRKMRQMSARYPVAGKQEGPSMPSSKEMNTRTVFLARTTSDLEPRRASIRSELTGRGHTVLPTEPLPDSGPELKAAVQELLAKTEVSVHLFGRPYGVIPEQETRSLGELQYQLAFAQRERPGFYHLVWIPEDLQNLDEQQQLFLARVRSNTAQSASGKGDVFETCFESFKEGLLDVLSRKRELPPLKAKAVYLLCDQPDLRREQLTKIKAYLRSRGHPVELPPFQGEPEELRELEEELICDTDAALIYYGAAKDAWILRKRKNLLKVLSKKVTGRDYRRALYLCTPKDEIKLDYLEAPDHHYLESAAFSPLLVLGDCEEFQPKKLDAFLELIEKEA